MTLTVMKRIVDIFIFINPKSGSKMGQKFLDLDFSKVQIEIDATSDVTVHLINLTNQEKKLEGLKEIKQLQVKYQSKLQSSKKKKSTANASSANTNINSANIASGLARSDRRIILTVAGGDGTLMYIAQDAVNEGINLDLLTMCLLPYGTGNDFAQIMGWGKQPKDKWAAKLKSLALEIL